MLALAALRNAERCSGGGAGAQKAGVLEVAAFARLGCLDRRRDPSTVAR